MIAVCALIVLLLDIISKNIIINSFEVLTKVTVIKNFLNLTYVRNTGAAWSLFDNGTYMLTIVSIIIIGLIIWYVYKLKPKNKFEKMGYSFIVGGALGNLIDRIVYGYVIDFLEFNIFGYKFPVFNLADTFITIGVLLLIICAWRNKK